MITPHIYLNSHCREAIQLYSKAFDAAVTKIIEDPLCNDLIIHAEIRIHDQTLMLNDTGGNLDCARSGGYQLSVQFDNKDKLLIAYSVLQGGAAILFPMQATDYSDCVVRFIDRFDVRWGFWI